MATIIAKLSMTKALLIMGALLIGISSLAQPAGSIDLTFNPTDKGFGIGEGPNAGPNLIYRSIAIQPDGKIVFGHAFTSFNGINRNNIARINADGSLDTSFDPGTGANNAVISVEYLSNGKLLIGGSFTQYNGIAQNRIARLNSNGSLDTSFNPGEGANGLISIIRQQSDGKILIGGDFTSYNGISVNRLARLNEDGSLDTSFSTGSGTNLTVIDLKPLQDGRILIGGNFTNYNGIAVNRLARINPDGSLDNTFNIGSGLSSTLSEIELQPDGKIIACGSFSTYNGTPRSGIVRINADGSIDSSFDPGSGASTPNYIVSMSLQEDGKIIIGGLFTQFNGFPTRYLTRLNSDGSVDGTFNVGAGPNNSVTSIALQSDQKILVEGFFTSFNNTLRSFQVRLNTDGSVDTSFGTESASGANAVVRGIGTQSDGKVILAGDFAGFNGRLVNYITRLKTNGTYDESFSSGSGTNLSILALGILPDDKLLIGGNFTSYNGISANRIARLNSDGTIDLSFDTGTGFASGNVSGFTFQDDGKIIVSGNFFSYNGVSRANITRLNADGTIDLSFDPGTGANSATLASAIQSDGKIIIGGAFTTYNGISINRIARLNTNGSLDISFNQGTGANGSIQSIVVLSDDKIVIGGAFTTYNGEPANRIARLNSDGTIDPTFSSSVGFNNSVSKIVAQADNAILAGGFFTSYSEVSRNRIARLLPNGTLDETFNMGTGSDNGITSMAFHIDNSLLIGGSFLSFNGVGRNRIARISLAEIPTNTADSLALVALYTTTNGANWTNNTNWLTGPVYTWHGVTVSGGRVVQVDLSGNQLNGTIPPELGNLTSLLFLNLGTNSLSGTIPDEVGNLVNLIECRLNNNQLTGSIPLILSSLTGLELLSLNNNRLEGNVPNQFTLLTNLLSLRVDNNFFSELPDLSTLISLTDFQVQNNLFTFEDLEPNIGRLTTYSPQRSFGDAQSFAVRENDLFQVSFVVGGTGNLYQWRRNNVIIVGATNPTFTIASVVTASAGRYDLTVTNNAVPGLTLTSNGVTLDVIQEGLFEWTDAGELTSDGLDANGSIDGISSNQNYSGQWGDFNNDGLEDIMVVGFSSEPRSFLYRNNGDGTFSKIPNSAYFYSIGRNMTWADFDEDGLLDCFAPNFAFGIDSAATASVWRNNGDETFTKITLPFLSNSGAWADTDNDGDLDLVLNESSQVNVVVLLRNDGNSIFTTLDPIDGITSNAWTPVLIDINNDNIIDLYNPSDAQRTLHIGNGDNTFTLNSSTPLTSDVLTGARGISFADIDNDGDMDAYVLTSTVGNRFYINDGTGQFTSRTSLEVLGETIFGGRGSVFFDYDNDGYVDLLTTRTNDGVTGWFLYKNNGNGTFTKQINQNFKGGGESFAGASAADYDNDGFVDIFSASFGINTNGLYRNIGNGNNWLKIKLVGKASNRTAIGSKIDVYGGGLRRHQQLITTNGFANQNSLILHFGMAGLTDADSIVVRFPSGSVRVLNNVAVNQLLEITETDPEDLAALTALYTNTDGTNWTNKSKWLSASVDQWFGITTNIDGRVKKIDLNTNNLSGPIPAEIGGLTAMDTLVLRSNVISGSLPPSIGSLSSLRHIDLGDNQITGGIPEEVYLLSGLQTLGLARNKIDGTISPEIVNMTGLINLWLDDNLLSGSLPDELGTLTNMEALFIQKNNFSGAVPTTLSSLNNLNFCGLDENQFISLPDMSTLPLTYFNVSKNKLTFESLEPNAGISGIVYAPQDSLGTKQKILLPVDSAYLFTSNVGGSVNQYQWKKNNTVIPGATSPTYAIDTVDFVDDGEYSYEVTSALVPGLILVGQPTQIEITSLYRDSIALQALFAATDGANWNTKTNWENTPLGSGNWFGVTVAGNRVTALNLRQNNLVGEVPETFTLARNISSIDLSENKITSLPDLTQITSLTTLDVSKNELDFGSLESNASLITVNYVDQAPLAPALYLEIPVNSDYEMNIPVGGASNQYQWKYNGQPIAGATTDTYTITGINRASMGNYELEVTNSVVPGLVLSSEVQRILATATIAGTLFAEETIPAASGNMYLLRITTSGAYDSLATQQVNTQGQYSFENILLDDYLVNGFADTLLYNRALPTWFDRTIFWEAADTIFLNDNVIGLDIISEQEPFPPTEDGFIVGTFYADFPGGRENGSDVRGRVKKAGVAVSRVQRIGRGKEDVVLTLVAYVFTNDEGEFNFSGLPTGTLPEGVEYRLNIQYPGYPMDTTSFVTIRLLPTLFDRQVGVEADVIDGKIVVRKLIITGWEEEDHGMRAYPNPTVEYLYITTASNGLTNAAFQLTDASGRQITVPARWDSDANRWELRVRELNPGVYILKVKLHDREKHLRIVVE